MSRSGFKWNVNELLSLQREFELFQWDIDTIAQKHQRTPNAIMYRLAQEGLADYTVLYNGYQANSTTTCDTITLEAVEEEPEPEDTVTLQQTNVCGVDQLATKATKPKTERMDPSPYIVFCIEKRPELRAAHPNATFSEMGMMLGQMWAQQMDDTANAVIAPSIPDVRGSASPLKNSYALC